MSRILFKTVITLHISLYFSLCCSSAGTIGVCNTKDGKCLCKRFVMGARCDRCQGQNNGKVVPREPQGGDVTWTGDGFTEVKDNAALEYAVTNVPYTGEYNI
ncbi:laminin, beta 2 (laminin S) [Desmophyllum pertusum]|uniref:Laminin, beta 2 (Laminin S) n=1 Tax=Desmophyllum pertusum TaxID=174260 RepID=A0A9W9ZK71_9CNID|nr:laminin, beta 2 (laminin S) [Desmophyllum pertusum]